MANLLKMAIRETIRTLHRRGWSQRRIAAELGINRETVARHIARDDSPPKPANAPTGPGNGPSNSKPANAPTGPESPRGRPSEPSGQGLGGTEGGRKDG